MRVQLTGLLLTSLLMVACDDAAPVETPAASPPPEATIAQPLEEVEPPPAVEEPVATTGRLLVTGGASGIGQATATRFLGESIGHLPMGEPVEIEAGKHELKVLDMKTGRGKELSIHVEAGQLMEIAAE